MTIGSESSPMYISYQVAQQSGNKELSPWVPAIITHFWFVSQHCGDDEDDPLKKEEIMKVGEYFYVTI